MSVARPDSLPSTVAPEEYPWLGPSAASALLLADGVVGLEPGADGGGRHDDAADDGGSSGDGPQHVGREAVGSAPAQPAEDQERPLVDRREIERALAAAGAAPLAERTLVLAVGSNQTPRTIARKYRRAGRELDVATPFVRCTVHGLAVGHVPRAAAPGYVPAAPYRAEGERMELVATWFDEEQLSVVDATEPNYRRLRLRAADCPVVLATGEEPEHVDVYASRWGVLARDGVPIPLRHRQQELFDELQGLTGETRLIGDAAEVCGRLAAQPDLVHDLAREHHLVVADGLPRP